jgi:hypothetical protein
MAIRNTCRFIFVTFGGIGSFLVIFLITNEDFLIPPNCHPTFGSPGACRNSWIAVGVLILLFSSALLALVPTLVTPRCCGSCSKRRAMPPRAALRRVWIVMRVFYFIIGPAAMLLGGMNFIGYFIREGTFCAFCTQMFSFGLTWVLAASFTYPRNRGRIHRWLINLGSRGDQQQEAACIAALINGSDANNVLSEGSKRFRALPLSSIDSDDLSHNKDTSMYVRTNEAKLGEVEAFISHSWHDAGAAKFAQLQHWGNKIRSANGREPSVWLDKACIDQDDIAANLASLPVFLSGCRSLVVLAGETYTTRLWCALELFTFLRMGGLASDVTVYRVGGEKVTVALKKFDALKAKCFFPRERERLLAVVEAGYGDVRPFNNQVRKILDGDDASIIDAVDSTSGESSGGGAAMAPHGLPNA